jgi:hypothetical protein
MTEWKLPPKAKVYEAMSAVAGGRVRIVSGNKARVLSSDGTREYTVTWDDDGRRYTSNDNASYWQGYAGYPIIAVLLATGTIDYDPATARPLAGVPWKRVNDRFRRDYEAAVAAVVRDMEAQGADGAAMAAEADRIYEQFTALKLERGPRKRPPPKAGAGRSEHD